MKLNKLLLVVLTLALAVCLFVACGTPAETEAPETDAPETNAPETDAPAADDGVCKHTDVEVDEKAATCEDRGYRIETCKACGEVLVEQAIPKAACSPAGAVSCTTDAVCSVCGKLVEPATGHAFGEAVVVAATCEAEGSSTQTCATCGETVVETFDKLAHNIPEANVTNVVAASCTAEGSKTGTCTICNKTQTVALPKAHVVSGLNDLSALTFVDGDLQASCSVCGAAVSAQGNVVLNLTFDGDDVASELATVAPSTAYAVTYAKDQSGASVTSPKIAKYADATDGHTSVLHVPHNRQAAVSYNGSLLDGAQYYVITFDWRVTSLGTASSANTIAAFGQINEKCETGEITDNNFANALMIERLSGDVYGPKKAAGNFALTAVAGEWYKVTVVVNNQTGDIATYINGQCFASAQDDKWIVTADGEYTWRFGGIYNVFHKPEYDNFTVSVLK